jgi:long-chain fatty acid transport protein
MKQHALALTLTTILATMAMQQAQAAAFNLNEHSASGLGRAFAGEAAIADNASVLSRNPAAMTRFKSMELSVAGTYVRPNIDLQGQRDITALGVGASDLDAQNIAPSAFIPTFYLIQPLNDRWAWGLGLFTNFGLSTEFDNDYAAGLIGGKTKLTTYNFNPNIAYRLNDQWSFGAGVSAVYADATLIRRAGAASASNPLMTNDTALVDLNGNTLDWGWNASSLFELDEANRWGLSYRSGTTLTFKGKFSGSASGVSSVSPLAFNEVDGTLDLKLPAIAEFSGYHKLAEQFAVHYSVQWTDWSVFKDLTANSPDCNDGTAGECFTKPEEFSDSWRYSIGGTYYLNDIWTLRAGLALDKQAAHNVISIPDTERLWYSLGLTYAANAQWSMDLGMAYLDGKDVNINESLSSGLNATYTSTASAFLAAAQLNYRF